MGEALAELAEADEFTEAQMLANLRQHLERRSSRVESPRLGLATCAPAGFRIASPKIGTFTRPPKSSEQVALLHSPTPPLSTAQYIFK
jgi:hypothetical protein